MKIAIQGIRGSFHDQAAHKFFADIGERSIELDECSNFKEVFESVKLGKADYGIVAVENSLHGSINPVYRLLASQDIWVCGEIRLHIAMCLIGSSHRSLSDLNSPNTTVMSHFAAFGQCEQWLSDNLPLANYLEIEDTALAVKKITEDDDDGLDAYTNITDMNNGREVNSKSFLAIASRHANDIYQGVILAENINDDPENYTRFFVIQKEQPAQNNPSLFNNWPSAQAANRTSIILRESSADKPGSLHEVLGIFAKYSINLSKIDSHPLPGKIRRYSFYIDFDTGPSDPNYNLAIKNIRDNGWEIQILGTYPAN